MPPILIIAHGNPLRGDDGLAWRASDELERMFRPVEVELLRVHQLAPELAEEISRFQAVIFLDAASAGPQGYGQPGEVRSEEICEPGGDDRFSHRCSPGSLVLLARQLYRATPRAYAVTLTGQCFDYGESLSPVVAQAVPSLLAAVATIVRPFLPSRALPL